MCDSSTISFLQYLCNCPAPINELEIGPAVWHNSQTKTIRSGQYTNRKYQRTNWTFCVFLCVFCFWKSGVSLKNMRIFEKCAFSSNNLALFVLKSCVFFFEQIGGWYCPLVYWSLPRLLQAFNPSIGLNNHFWHCWRKKYFYRPQN